MEKFLQEYPIQSVEIKGTKYPEELKKINEAPEKLYFRGNIDLVKEKCFSIVGTRLASDYGKEVAFSFAKSLSEAGLVIVSGMALGIDSFSHKGALEGSKKTIAVLGTGLDEPSIYPQENLKLAKQILEKGGCLISEYPAGTRGTNFTFPQRNRIIAGISIGVLVVEAKIKSGALITANYAKKYKKPVFSIPGSIYSLNSKGTHLLIRNGEILVESPKDILKKLNITNPNIKNAQKNNLFENNIEFQIASALSEGAKTIDKIIELTKLPSQKVSSALSIMELDEKVKNLGGNIYSLIR